MITFHSGNILDSGADLICHQVNCQGAMNSGVAKAIREKWPQVYDEYIQKYKDRENEILLNCSSFEYMPSVSETLLGDIQVVFIADKNTMAIVNMFAQAGYGYDGRRYTSYDAFWSCLGEIKRTIKPGLRIACPARIGCVRGGANWNVILTMIEEVLGMDYNIEIWDFDRG
jgi:O-acetyl-ADP-ribose deacetylase (regulator of RNase III)